MTEKCGICPISCSKYSFCGAIELKANPLRRVYNSVKIKVCNIERLGFYHYKPGSRTLGVVTSGCNLSCSICPEYKTVFGWGRRIAPEELASRISDEADRADVGSICFYCNSILDLDVLRNLSKHSGYTLLAITHGFAEEEHVRRMLEVLDGVLVRFFGFSEEEYSRVGPIPNAYEYALRFLRDAYKAGVHVEAEYFLIVGISSIESFRSLINSICSISRSIPLHIRRFRPAFLQRERAPTPTEILQEYLREGRKTLSYVYADIWRPDANNTYCPRGHLVVERFGWVVQRINLDNGRCPTCGEKVPIVT